MNTRAISSITVYNTVVLTYIVILVLIVVLVVILIVILVVVLVLFYTNTDIISSVYFNMQIIGLTGGIGTGKSTSCKLLRELDPKIVIIDADILSHEATQPGKLPYLLLKHLILPKECFETEHDPADEMSDNDCSNNNHNHHHHNIRHNIRHNNHHNIRHNGKLIRSKLAELIFAPDKKSKALKKIVERCIHPWVIWRMILAIIWYWLRGHSRIVLDIPLLFEANLKWMCTRTVLIDIPSTEIQLKRILERCPQMNETEAINRISSQFPMERKRKMADFVVFNDGNLGDLKVKLADALKEPCIWHQRIVYLYIPVIILILLILIFVIKFTIQ